MARVRTNIWICFLTVTVSLLISGLATTGATAEQKEPTADWRTSIPEDQGMRSDVLADLLERIRWNDYQIHSVLIVRNGHLVLDAHFPARWKRQRHATYSVTKSVVSALIGIAIDKGHIAGVDTPVADFFPERTIANMDARKRAMTLEHLLTMTTGLKCRDSYLYSWAGYMKMRQSSDWTQFVLDLPMEAVPGEKFEYCNGASFLLSAILTKVTKTDTLDFARTHLFAPLGITDVSWSRGSRKIRNGCCGLSLTPRAMAKFGQLFLNHGKWGGRQVISSEWVRRATGRHVDPALFDHYGYQWWGDGSGYYMAVGYKGQRIFVIPQKNMVAVFTGNLEGSTSLAPKGLLDKYIIPAATSDAPLSSNAQQQKRLTELVATLADPQSARRAPNSKHVWRNPADGTAHDGTFVRRSRPAFQFGYPPGSRRDETQAPTEIMRMRTPSDVVVSTHIMDIPDGVALEDVGPVSYAALLKEFGSDVEITANKPVPLSEGTAGYRTDFRWKPRGSELRTVVVSVFSDQKWIVVATHHRADVSVAAEIINTLVFQLAK